MKPLRVSVVLTFVLTVMCHPGRVSGTTLTPLRIFGGGADGGSPDAGLVQGSDSNFYGTTSYGGTHNSGVVFRITSSGTFTNLHRFIGYTDGSDPEAPLIQGSDGNFYGTTYDGGTNDLGTVFQITASGTTKTLWQFRGPDGDGPEAGLIQGSDSNFYGTTAYGGTNSCYCGTVFKITAQGTLTSLWQFSSGADGDTPLAGLIQAGDSIFYGTTYTGGGGGGTAFKITSSGTLSIVYSFSGGTDGSGPYAELLQGSDTNFYGTTFLGGSSGNGVVFKLTPQGMLTPLWQFGGGADGANPTARLIRGNDGLFYGTASMGGTADNWGLVFRTSAAAGTLTNLYLFTGNADGGNPVGPVIQASDGNFYGTTSAGGTNGNGGVFKLVVPATSVSLTQISAIKIVGTNVAITLPSVSNQIYQLQYSNSLIPTNWVNLGALTNSNGGALQFVDTDAVTNTQRFYRIEIGP